MTRDEFSLQVAVRVDLGMTTSVFGPSGSGKTTLLRAIAGFDQPTSGHIRCGDATWFDSSTSINIPAHLRGVGYLFQEGRLFTHLDVAGNLQYAYRRRRRDMPALRPASVIDAFDLQALLARRISSLSGGERQRVALARTLVSAPRLLLLDEPLAALDYNRKADILPYLENLPERFAMPTLLVSHNIDEVTHLADQALSLKNGRVDRIGSVADLVDSLDLDTNTGRFDAAVLVEGAVISQDPRLHLTHVDTGGPVLAVPGLAPVASGERIRLRIRARDVAIAISAPQGLSIRNVIPGVITDLVLHPEVGAVDLWISTAGPTLRSRITLASVEELGLTAGRSVFALVKSASIDS